jgi:glycosyl transferase family 87
VLSVGGWLAALAFLAWAVRLVALEGYLYEIPGNFLGDFTRTAELGAPTWFTGTGMFYGPIFVLEYRFLFAPQIMSPGDFARVDFLLFGIAFICVWLALIGPRRPALAVFVLAAWLAHHMSVEAFANTAHLEVLELTFIALALLLAMRGHTLAGGVSLGLAIATKVLPGLFLPYLAITRKWKLFASAAVAAAIPFVVTCWIQGISVLDGAYALVYQGGNLTKLEYSEYEYTPRAEIARALAGEGGTVTPDQARLAIGIHFVIALVTLAAVAWFLARTRVPRSRYGLLFGLICAVMLVVAPSAHAPYYIFLLPGWTAIFAAALAMPFGMRGLSVWIALTLAYVFTGFDQVFFAMQRVFGFGIVVPQHWLAWHLPTIGLLLTLGTLVALLHRPLRVLVTGEEDRPALRLDTRATFAAESGRALSP